MTKKFDEAKAETVLKWKRVYEAIREVSRAEHGRCGFCERYYCVKCPVEELCGHELHQEIQIMLDDLELRVAKGLLLLEKVKEKSHS